MTENDVSDSLKAVKKPPVNLPSNIVSRNEAKGSGRQQLLTRQSQMQVKNAFKINLFLKFVF